MLRNLMARGRGLYDRAQHLFELERREEQRQAELARLRGDLALCRADLRAVQAEAADLRRQLAEQGDVLESYALAGVPTLIAAREAAERRAQAAELQLRQLRERAQLLRIDDLEGPR